MRQIPDRILPVEEVTIQKKKYHLDKHYLADPRPFGSCLLFQLGRLWCTEETVVAKHAHINWFELTIVTEGKGIVSTGDHSPNPPDVSVHSRETCFPCTASTYKPRIDSHHGGTWESPVGKARVKATEHLVHAKGTATLLLQLGRKAHVHAPTGDED